MATERWMKDETTQPGMRGTLEDAVLGFRRRIYDVTQESSDFASALRRRALVDVEAAANDLVRALHDAAKAATTITDHIEDARTHERLAEYALRVHRRSVSELFRRALLQTEGTNTHAQLLRLAAQLDVPGEDAQVLIKGDSTSSPDG